MSICIYTYNGVKFESLEKLAQYYYKSNFPLKNHNLYSTDEIVDSTLKKIKNKIVPKDEVKDSLKPSLTDIVSRPNTDLMKRLGLSIERFAPEYQEDARKAHYLKTHLEESGIKESELKDKDLKELLSYPEAKGYLSEIDSIIEAEKKSNILMMHLRNAISLGVMNMGEYRWGIEELQRGVNKSVEEGLIEEGTSEILESKLISIYQEILSIIHSHGTPMADFFIATDNDKVMQEMLGHFDVVVVDDDGHTHIYSIKSSKGGYEDWDPGKKLGTDYQLAFQRALVGQYVNISQTTLNIIPISTGDLVGGKLNPRHLHRHKVVSRSGDPKGGLQYGTGKLFLIANQIIPNVVRIDTNDERRDKIIEDLKFLMPNYEIRTTNRNIDKERIVNQIKRNGFFVDKTSEFKLELAAKADYIIVEGDLIRLKDSLNYTAEELDKKAEEIADAYIAYLEVAKNKNVIGLKNAIITAINSGNPKSLSLHDVDQAVQAQKVLVQYLNNNYRVLDAVQEMNDLGMILMQNKRNGHIVAISISANNTQTRYDKDYSYRDAEYFKVFTILNNLNKELGLEINKLQEIIVFDVDGKSYTPGDIDYMFEKYKELASSKSYGLNIGEKNFLNFAEQSEKIFEGALYSYNETDKADMQNIFKDIEGNLSNISVEELTKVIAKFEKNYQGLAEKIFNSEVDFTKPEEYLYVLLKTMLLGKYGLVPAGDSTNLRNYALKVQDFTGVISALYRADPIQYNRSGEEILGAIGGLKMVTPDRMPSKDLFQINQIIATTVGLVRQGVDKESNTIKGLTRKFYKAVGFKGFQRNVIGDFRGVFKNLWLQTNDEISAEWKTKNPYSDDHVLKEAERDYLKAILFLINKQYLNISDSEAAKIDYSSLESIEKTAGENIGKMITQRIGTGEYFRMPLIRSKSWTRHQKLFTTSKQKLGQGIQGILAETKDFVDGRELYADDLARIKKDTRKYTKLYEVYGKQSEEFIARVVTENGPVAYEIDLDDIAHRIAFEKIKKRTVDKVFPVLNAYAWWIKMNGGKANKDVSVALESIKDSIDKALLDEPIIENEFGDVVTAAGIARKITTPLMLGMRPALFLKETALGLFRGASIAMTQFFGKDQFTFQEYMSALKTVFTPSKLDSEEFNQVQAVNAFYGFANMDLNSYTHKVKTNRWPSLFTGIGPIMYSMNTMPDYFNRLSLFIAKMNHDGSYKAHSQDENGRLIYDATKDGRFAYYFAHRDANKNQFGKFIPSKTDEKYNRSRNLYLLIQEELNIERKLEGKNAFEENEDIIDKAYSEKERQSYKSFTDSIYGYYDKETAPA